MSDSTVRHVAVKSRTEFRNYYMLHNLKGVQTLCLIFWGLNIAIRLILSFLPSNLTRAQNFPEFNLINWIHVIISPVFFAVIYLTLQHFKKTAKATQSMSILVVLYSMYIILSGMASSFVVTYIPTDNPITFMIALTVVGVVCVLEYAETWIITAVSGVIFMIALVSLTAHDTEILYNLLVCAILLTGFFFISRYNYSYRVSHFLKLVEINRKNIEIERASNFKNEVLGMVAHDLRNPIAAIESISMLMEMDVMDEDTRDNIHMVQQSCRKARGIIDDLLEVARNESTAVFATQKTDINTLLKNITDIWITTRQAENNVVFISKVPGIYADINAQKLQRAIDNLISNAVKFSKDSTPVEVVLSKNADYALIEIKDYGLGIPPEMLPHIFDRFSKAGRKGVRGEESTGLGLSIVRQIIDKHKGKIEVQSEVGRGSTFSIYLPLAV